jgi:DMSO reductase family type II enzyme molybdopterin subunit
VNTNPTRREFLRGAAAVCALSLVRLRVGEASAQDPSPGATLAPQAAPYTGFEDVYREAWRWDSVQKSSHFVNCWYQRGCNWNVFVKGGIAWREEQAATYPQTNEDVPDFNPRGCQKGACYSERMYDASRVLYPLKRAGERGEGKWKRVSWDEALREIGEACVDAIASDGPGALQIDEGTAIANGCNGLGLYRTHSILDVPFMDMNSECGDHRPGVYATTGKLVFSGSADDFFYSDLILCWGGNPAYTQIPNAHFMNEARYHGARVITIAPDYSASAVHADLWIPLDVGTDAALGLGAAHVMVEEGLCDEAFLVEQTDMPLLVRTDTGELLRERDVEADGADDRFYVFDRASGEVRLAPQRSLALEGLEPALDGVFRVRTLRGEIEASPVFARLRQHLSDYTPEAASKITGVHPNLIRRFAREVAKARAAVILAQANFSKFYHGLEMERAQLLVLTLAGHVGKKGAGITGFPFIAPGGVDGLAAATGPSSAREALRALEAKLAPAMQPMAERGYTPEMMIYAGAREEYAKAGSPAANLFFYTHGGMDRLWGRSKEWDPHLRRELSDYLEESFAKGWQADPSGREPRIFFQLGGNVLRRIRGNDRLHDGWLPRLDLLVTVDFRMSTTALHSDYVLPAAGWYEKDDITWSTTLAPFAHPVVKVVEPLGEAKSDWAFHCLLVKEIQAIARKRGIRSFTDRAGVHRRLDRVYDDFTFEGRYTEDNPDDLLREIMACADNLGGASWDELKEKGFVPYTAVGAGLLNIGSAMDFVPNETLTANTWHTRKKLPWPTLTRRIQFFIDHPFYRELGEVLPVHKDDPPIGGIHPLRMTGGHTRWSIHATWRDQKHMLQLNRGGPTVFLGRADAGARGIADGDRVRVRNDIGSFEASAKVSAALRPGQVIVYHAWEPYMFEGRKTYQSTIPAPINPIQLAGGYFHLQPMLASGAPASPDRGTRVEVERIERHSPVPRGGEGR